MTDPLNIEEGRAALKTGTERPWLATTSTILPDQLADAIVSGDYLVAMTSTESSGCGEKCEADARLIVYAVNNLSALLDAAEERDRLREALDRIMGLPSENIHLQLFEARRIAAAGLGLISGDAMKLPTESDWWVNAHEQPEWLGDLQQAFVDANLCSWQGLLSKPHPLYFSLVALHFFRKAGLLKDEDA